MMMMRRPWRQGRHCYRYRSLGRVLVLEQEQD
jgi:hypothetical protein